MNLYILRHGLAGSYAGRGDDSKRPLTPKGKRKLGQIAQALEAMSLSFDLILSSPYARARETAEIIAEAFGARRKLELSDTLVPGGSVKQLIERLNGLAPSPKAVLLTGHEPYLSRLIALLVSGNTASSVRLKKGGLCKLSAPELKLGRCATLEWLLTPKQMELMAGWGDS